jgi:hypothetical protein
MMNGYDEKAGFSEEPEPGSFVKSFDAFRKETPGNLNVALTDSIPQPNRRRST